MSLRSWSEIPPGYKGPALDPFYTLTAVAAAGLLALFLRPPQRLDVDVALEGLPAGGVLHARLSPRNPSGDYLRPPSSERGRDCRPAQSLRRAACRVSFHWPKGERPLLPQEHSLALSLEQGGRRIDLGAVRLGAPRWWRGPARVVCTSAGRCEEVDWTA